MPGAFEPLEGIVLKIRTTDTHVTATVWVDGEAKLELATLHKAALPAEQGSSAPEFQAWLALMQELFDSMNRRVTGIDGITSKRRAPDRRNDHGGPD